MLTPQAKEQAEYNRAQKAKEAMEAEGGDDMAKAEAFLQMTTAKLTKARTCFYSNLASGSGLSVALSAF